jgi:spermidine/putrescine transport system substrate-binding protein
MGGEATTLTHPFDTVPGRGQTAFSSLLVISGGTAVNTEPLSLDPLTRGTLLRRAGAGALGVSAASLLAACGSSSSSGSSAGGSSSEAITGQAILANYPGWIGKHNLADFAKKYPGASIKMISNATSSSAEVVLQFKSKDYDFLLADTSDAGQASAAKLVSELDWSKIPNAKNVAQQFRTSYPWGLPTDYGKVGIAYRPDLVGGATITSWHDLWELIPKYSGQTIFIDLERDTMGSTCKYLGFSSNTTDPDQLKKVQDAVVSVKPHLQAFLNTNVGAGLVNGSVAMAMDWDYDVALLQQKNDKIKWVLPEEGVHAYLEGFTAVLNTSKIAVIQAFLNFLSEPAQYADFVNTTGTAYVMPAATPLILKTISQNPVLVPTKEVLAKTEFDKYLGAAGATLWSNTWTAIKAA